MGHHLQLESVGLKQAAAELGQAQPQLGLGLTRAVLVPDGLFLGLKRGSKTVMISAG